MNATFNIKPFRVTQKSTVSRKHRLAQPGRHGCSCPTIHPPPSQSLQRKTDKRLGGPELLRQQGAGVEVNWQSLSGTLENVVAVNCVFRRWRRRQAHESRGCKTFAVGVMTRMGVAGWLLIFCLGLDILPSSIWKAYPLQTWGQMSSLL